MRYGFCMNLGLQQYTINKMLNCQNLFWISFSKEDLEIKLHLPENFIKITTNGLNEVYCY